jgi:hypothetical protein
MGLENVLVALLFLLLRFSYSYFITLTLHRHIKNTITTRFLTRFSPTFDRIVSELRCRVDKAEAAAAAEVEEAAAVADSAADSGGGNILFIVTCAVALCSVLVEDDCDKICDGGWKERPYAWNPVG